MSKLPGRVGRLQLLCVASLFVFVAVIFVPPIYVLSYAFKSGFQLGSASKTALLNSLAIGAAVTFADLLIGLPVAWVLAKRNTMRLRHFIDTLVDMPLVVPTSVLGLSVYYFWGNGMGSLFGVDGGLIGKGPLLIALLHVVFTFPYIVRSIEAAIVQIDRSHEQAATMLGAPPLTVFRTVSMPLFKAGLISGMILVFTRSLSETGATMMVAGLFPTAPTIVVQYKSAFDTPSAAAISAILVGIAVVLLFLAKIMSRNFKIPIVHVWPREERILSRRYGVWKDLAVASCVVFVVLLPTFYVILTGLDTVRAATFAELLGDGALMQGIIVSFAVGLTVTVVNLTVAIPLGILVSRNMFKIGTVVDTMSDIILAVPTSALGLSLGLFWKNFGFNEYLILTLAHLSFTFPLMLRPISAALTGVNPGLEEAARTLGARQLTVFKTIIYPIVRPAIVAGIIMTFMRSLSETGATLAVSENIKTIPVLLVEIFTKGKVDDKTELACILLFAISFAFIVVLKRLDHSQNAKH